MVMTSNNPETTPGSKPPRSRLKLAAVGVTIGVIVAALVAAWWLGLLTPEPEAVSLAATVQAVEDETAADTAEANTAEADAADAEASAPDQDATTQDPTPEDPPPEDQSEVVAEPSAATSATDVFEGTWTVVESDATFAGYRADSQVGEAVGRTPGVSGSLTAVANTITSTSITVDMTQLTSDSSLRDGHLGDEGIEHNTYPTSVFELSEPISIDTIPADGVATSFEAIGMLTVRDIAQPVTIDLDATLVGDQLVVAGSTTIDLDDYGASVSDTTTAIMEFSLVFRQ